MLLLKLSLIALPGISILQANQHLHHGADPNLCLHREEHPKLLKSLWATHSDEEAEDTNLIHYLFLIFLHEAVISSTSSKLVIIKKSKSC